MRLVLDRHQGGGEAARLKFSIGSLVEEVKGGVPTVDLNQTLHIFRREGRGADYQSEYEGKLSRFIIEALGEELHASLFARYLAEQTGAEYTVYHAEPTTGDKAYKKRLDCYVGPAHPPARGDKRLRVVFACEVKSWNDNGLHSCGGKVGEERIGFYSTWLHKQLPTNKLLEKLGHAYKRPPVGKFAVEVDPTNALLIYHPQSTACHNRAVPEGDQTGTAFWADFGEHRVLVFSGEGYIRRLLNQGVISLNVVSPSLDAKLKRLKSLLPEAFL